MLTMVLRVAAVVAASLGILLCVNLLAGNVDPAFYRTRAIQALEGGELAKRAFFPLAENRSGTAAPYRYNHNDCIILSALTVKPRGNVIQRSLSPLEPMERAQRADARVPDHEACWRFAEVLEDPARPAEFYHRYIHGHWVLAAALLPFLSYATLTSILLLISLAIPLTASAIAGVRQRARNEDARRNLAYLLAGIAGAALISMNNYGRSLSFAPSDIVIFSFLLFSLVRPLSALSDRTFVVVVALFGAFTAMFEFLTGAIPAALAVLLACLAFDPSPDARLLVRRAAQGLFCFTLAILLAFLLKWLVVAMIWDWQALSGAVEKLAGWTRESRWSPSLWAFPEIHQLWSLGYPPERVENSRLLTSAFAFLRMANQSVTMGFGSPTLGFLIIVVGPILLAATSAAGTVFGRTPVAKVRALLILLGPLAFLAWHAVFVHHSILHAYFMQRPFSWLTMLLFGWLGWLAGRHGVRAAS